MLMADWAIWIPEIVAFGAWNLSLKINVVIYIEIVEILRNTENVAEKPYKTIL